MVVVKSTPKPVAISAAKPWLAHCQLAKKPARSGRCSTRNAVELANSPPTEKPCNSRAAITRIGDRMPSEP